MTGTYADHRRGWFQRCFNGSPAFLLLCILAFSVPLENSLTVPEFGTWSRLLGLVVVVVAVLEVFMGRSLRLPSEILLPVVLFVVWSAITGLWSAEPAVTADRAATNLRLLILVWVIWQCVRTIESQRLLLQCFVAGSFCAAFDTVMRLRRNEAVDVIRFAGAGWDPNELALILAVSVAVAAFLAATGYRGFAPVAYGAHVLLASAAILLTGSRGSFLAFCAGGLVIVWYRLRDPKPITPAMIAMLCAGALLCLLLIPEATWDRLGSIYGEIDSGTFTKRTVIWRAGLEAFAAQPILGSGAGTFGFMVLGALDRAYVAHNTYLSVLLETGIVGFSLLAWTAFTCLWVTFHLPFGERRLWLCVLVILGVGMFSLTWEYKKTLWLLIALLMSRGALPAVQRRACAIPNPARLRHADV